VRKDEGTRKMEGDERTFFRVPNRSEMWEVNRTSGSGRIGPLRPAILSVRRGPEAMSEA
jgi:hypothetical protein